MDENEPHCYDGFPARLTADLKTLTRASYLGGSGNDNAVAITLSGFFPISIFQRESIVVSGSSNSTNFPGTAGSAQPMNGGGGADGFVANLTLAPTFGGVSERRCNVLCRRLYRTARRSARPWPARSSRHRH